MKKLRIENHTVPVVVHFKDYESQDGLANFLSWKICSVLYDDGSHDTFSRSKNGMWRCHNTDQLKCRIEELNKTQQIIHDAYKQDLVSWSGDAKARGFSPYWIDVENLEPFVDFVLAAQK